MKKLSLFLVVILCLMLFAACGQEERVYTAEDVTGMVYTYEKEGFGGPFTITIQENGRFSYYVGFLSSYIGMGTWTVEDGVLILQDEILDYKNHYIIGDGTLTYRAEGSTGVMYLGMEDGDRFFGEPYDPGPVDSISLDGIRDLVLEQAVTEEELAGILAGLTCEQMKDLWGEPDGMCSGLWCDFWELDDTHYIGVYYDGDGVVSDVHLGEKE